MKEKGKKRSFCKWDKKEIKRNIDRIYDLTADPRYVCRKCVRVAREKSHLCEPVAFNRPE